MRKRYTDQEIINGLLQRKPALTNAITRYLYEECRHSVTWMVLQNRGSSSAAHDLFQDTLLTFLDNVWQGRYQLRSEARVTTYFYGIARNLWLKELEKEHNRDKRAGTFVRSLNDELPDDPSPEEELIGRQDTERGWNIFNRLGPLCRDVLTAYYRDQKPLLVIAQELGLGTEQNAKTRKYRCMQKLKDMLS